MPHTVISDRALLSLKNDLLALETARARDLSQDERDALDHALGLGPVPMRRWEPQAREALRKLTEALGR